MTIPPHRHAIHGWLLLLPAMALLALFTHWPALATFIDSFYSTPRPRRPARFVGLDNTAPSLADPVFWHSLWNNLWFALGTIPVSIALAILMAVWVNDRIAGRTLVRMAYFTPTVLPMIAVANIWLFFYTPQYGLLEQVLSRFGVPSHNWLGSQDTALAGVIVVAIWKEAGFFMIFYLAALQRSRRPSPKPPRWKGASRLDLLPPRAVSAADADHAVRAGQRGDQRVPHRRPHHRDDARRAGQRHHAAALLHLPGRLQFLGHDLCGGADHRAAGAARRGRRFVQYGLLERRIHYR